jgi:GT2 family glycosyltransferase
MTPRAGTAERGEEPGLRLLRGWRAGGRGARLEDCSLVVPTFGRPGEVARLLGCLAGLDEGPAEVALIDGSRDRRTEEAVKTWSRAFSPAFDLLYVASPAGLTLQRNVGIDVTGREFVFFLDDDCLPERGYFSAVRHVFEGDDAGRVGGVAGTTTNEVGGRMSRRWKMRFALGLYRRGEPGRYYPTATSVPVALATPFSGAREVDILPGCAMTFRREVFRQERFSGFFDGYSQGEDLEMSLRVGRAWRLLWSGDARVIHEHASAARPRSFAKGRMEIRNRFFIWRRHTPRPPLGEQFHFWADVAFMFAYDAASFALRKGRRADIEHAAGMLRGAFSCLVRPPRYSEPAAIREFGVHWEDREFGR